MMPQGMAARTSAGMSSSTLTRLLTGTTTCVANDDCWKYEPWIHSPLSLMVGVPSARLPPKFRGNWRSQISSRPTMHLGHVPHVGHEMITRSPGFTYSTPGATSSTTPVPSCPTTAGMPSRNCMFMSVWQTPTRFDLDIGLTCVEVVQFDVLDGELALGLVDDRRSRLLAHQRPPYGDRCGQRLQLTLN